MNIPKGYQSNGIDVSHHQGKINWSRLFNTYKYDTIIHFVYCKATEGSTHIDKNYEYNQSELINLNVKQGAYHFFTLTSPPTEQAQHFLNVIKHNDFDLPPVLDVEIEDHSNDSLIEKMKIWLEIIEEKTGKRPVIYTSLHFFETKFQNQFQNYKFWIAAYKDSLPSNDKRIIHWQYTDNAQLPGLKGRIDANVSNLFKKE